ncbi:MAG: GNAT family N-acetyltransferase [Anaerolineales bacterium]|nr:GNAT family N-acetyltransferase [Anaerolineales bacterium]
MTDLPFSIRQFVFPQDYLPARRLWELSGPGVHVRRSDQPEEIAKKLKRDPELFLVAEQGGVMVGTVIGGFDGRRGLVYHLAVHPDYRQAGIGQALMLELEARWRRMGCLRAYLLVTRDNPAALDFYEKRGWERMDLHLLAKDIPE